MNIISTDTEAQSKNFNGVYHNSVVCDSILTSAAMQNCKVRNTQITNCQLDGFEHHETDMSLTSCVTGQTEEQTNSLNYS